ncbi:putative membrane protein YphA (DoxX/SURF4 family) [Paenibacillus mucilaginosus]|uniref:DoxX family protein n=1 Tax=Paenibacillus mucilaginosus TaxID=61624 RepID=UPI003D238987
MTILTIILQSLLIAYYIFSGTAKMFGVKYWTDIFENLKLPKWLLPVTGVVQFIGAAGLIAGYWYVGALTWGAVWLGITMLVACFVHVRAKDPFGKTVPALVFAVLNITLIVINAGTVI